MSNQSANIPDFELLASYRAQIDACDTAILQLLQQRIQVVKLVGEYKKTQNTPALDPKRWQIVLDNLEIQCRELDLDFELVQDLWNRIHTFTVALEKQI